jgi:hypothetical protein
MGAPPLWIELVGYVLQSAAAILAVVVTRRRAFHRAFAAFTIVLALSDPLLGALGEQLRAMPAPYIGTARAMFHVSQACTILPPVALLIATWSLVRKNVGGHLAGAATLLWVVLCVSYPCIRGACLQTVYAVLHGACQVGTWAAIIALFRKGITVLPTHALVIATVAADLALWVGPFAGNVFADWHLAAGSYLALQVTTIAVQAAWLRSFRA